MTDIKHHTPEIDDKMGFELEHVEKDVPVTASATATPPSEVNLAYSEEDVEPEIHLRTYLALFALFLLNVVQVVGLTGPPSMLDFMAKDLKGSAAPVWIPNALSLIQAVGGPLISFASDTFQARKLILIVTCSVSFIGCAVAATAKDVSIVILAQVLIGVGFAAVPLAYAIPSEILPRRWRPLAQSLMNIAAAIGAVTGPLSSGAFIRKYGAKGWKNFFMALWGATVAGIFLCYNPPKRHTKNDHLSLVQKLQKLDLPGMALLTTGLTLLLTGLTLGDNPWSWTNARVLSTLIIGIATLVAFGLYEWKGTKEGILHHELFIRRTFPLCVALMFIEGILLFSIIVFYPALTGALFEKEPLLAALRAIPFWLCSGASTVVYGFWSSKRRTIRSPMMVGFAIFTAGLVGMATIQPGQNARVIIFDALAGLGFGSPLILIIASVQLSTPHHLIATATAVVTSSRAVAASTFTAIYGAALGSKMKVKLPSYIAAAAIAAGLPPQYVAPFLGGFLEQNTAAIEAIPDVTPSIMGASVAAMGHAQADSFRTVYIIAAPFGVVACLLCFFLEDMTKLMSYRVDAPVEELHARRRADEAPA